MERHSHFQAIGRDTADNFRNCSGRVFRIAGIFAFRREDKEVITTRFEAGGAESFQQDFFGGSGISCTFEANQLSFAKRPGYPLRGVFDVLKVGVLLRGQRRGDANDDAVRFSEPLEICRRFESFLFNQHPEPFGGNVSNVGFPGLELSHFGRIDIEAEHGKVFFSETQDERQTDVSQTDNADSSFVRLDFCDQIIFNSPLRTFTGSRSLSVSWYWLNFNCSGGYYGAGAI